MEKQKIFKTSYANFLLDQVNKEESIDEYKNSEFVIDHEKTLLLPNIYFPEDLNWKLKVEDDYSSAITLYEAYENLSPIQAADKRFWIYLSHVDLYGYMKLRWNSAIKKKYVLDHWFLTGNSQSTLMDDNLAGLWWAVYLSIDKQRSDKYELTKLLLKQRDFAFRTLGRYKLARYKPAVHAILEFILKNEAVFSEKFETKTRSLTSFLNMYFGTKLLTSYSKDDIFNVLLSWSEEFDSAV